MIGSEVRYLLSLLLLILCSCRQQDEVKTIIEGRNIFVPESKVYLTTVERNALVVDSANVKKGDFRISVTQKKHLVRACIVYRDDFGNPQVLRFIDPNSDYSVLGNRRYSDHLAIESGTIYIDGLTKLNDRQLYAFLTGQEENALLFNPEFHFLNTLDDHLIKNYDKAIGKLDKLMASQLFSTSNLVLEKIYDFRNLFKKGDLHLIVSRVHTRPNSQRYVEYLHRYLNHLPENFDPNDKIWLNDGNDGRVTNYNQKRALNMLIFSTTWSHQSSLLLHYLKNEQQNFHHSELYLVDIGLDEFEDWWEPKLIKSHEKKWDQLHVPREQRANMIFRHKLTRFPTIIFTNRIGREIYRIEGYDEQTLERSRSFIEHFFANRKLNTF